METNSEVGVPLMLLTALACAGWAILILYAIRTRRRRLAAVVAAGGLGWLAIYFGLLVAASVTSEAGVLGLNEEKRFCGFYLDCHILFNVLEVRKEEALGTPPSREEADGVFYVVTVGVRSDARRAELGFEAAIELVDGRGRRFGRSTKGERALAAAGGEVFRGEQSLAAGASRADAVVFDVPSGIEDPHLLINEGFGPARFVETFLIGDEDSLLHARTTFRLEPPSAPRA
jgi:hypothetical protein